MEVGGCQHLQCMKNKCLCSGQGLVKANGQHRTFSQILTPQSHHSQKCTCFLLMVILALKPIQPVKKGKRDIKIQKPK